MKQAECLGIPLRVQEKFVYEALRGRLPRELGVHGRFRNEDRQCERGYGSRTQDMS